MECWASFPIAWTAVLLVPNASQKASSSSDSNSFSPQNRRISGRSEQPGHNADGDPKRVGYAIYMAGKWQGAKTDVGPDTTDVGQEDRRRRWPHT